MKKTLVFVLMMLFIMGSNVVFAEGQQEKLVGTTISAIPLNTAKTSPVAFPKMVGNVNSKTSDTDLKILKQMGINHVELAFADNELTYEAAKPIVDRIRNFEHGGFTITLGSNNKLQKDKAIHLAEATRDAEIERFKNFVTVLGQLDIPVVAVAWQPNGISRSTGVEARYSHGGTTNPSDMQQIVNFPVANDRVYTREEMWETFEYFIDAVLPTCEASKVAIALHPNDPPVPSLQGVGSLIISFDDYRRAFEIANDSPYLGMKLCIGCVLEGGLLFTDNLLADIDDMVKRGKILNVHFRNVSNPINADYSGYFEETLAQDGYADMYEIMKQFVRSGYNGSIFCDHAFRPLEGHTYAENMNTSNAYIMGLINAARNEVGKEMLKASK